LCLSYFHLHSREIGARRFKVLKALFEKSGIKLDVITGRFPDVKPDENVVTAGSFSPFCSTINRIWGLKRRLVGKSSSASTDLKAPFAYGKSGNLLEITKDRGLRSFINSFCQLPDPYAGWILPAILKVIGRGKKYDFIISTAPPWSSHLAAIFIGRLLGIPVILDDRDPWADSVGRMAIITHPLMRKLDKLIAEYCYSRARGIVCVTRAACDLRKKKSGNDSVPVEFIPNGYDPILDQYYRPKIRSEEITIIHVGSTYHGRSPLIILEAAKGLDEGIAKDFHFRFIGKISDAEMKAIDTMEKNFRVTTDGLRDHEYCLKAIIDSDICLLMAIGQPLQIPSKVYEYIGLGRCVLVVSEDDSSTMRLLENKEWIWAVTVDNKDGLTRALQDVHRRWKNDRLPVSEMEKERKKFNFNQVFERYAYFIKEIVNSRRLNKR
jgi:glycosyltransferase involved in cell wall biosynthesis